MKIPISSDGVSEAPTVDHFTLEFLRWVAARIATYSDAWEAWQTSCPRQSTWEDSFVEGYVSVERRGDSMQPIVVLTPLGRSILDGAL